MHEGNNAQQPEDEKLFREIIETEVGGSFPALLRFDSSRSELYDTLANLATQVPELISSGEPRYIDIEEVNGSFEALITSVYQQEGTSAGFLDTVVDLVLSDSKERISMMRAALDDNSMPDFKRESLKGVVMDLLNLSESSEDIIDNLVQLYNYDLSSDIQSYMEHLVHNSHYLSSETQSTQASTPESKKELKDHITDVAKIALGVSIALAADKLLRRKH